MFPSKVLLSLTLMSLAAVDASPLSRSTGKATLSFARRINESGTLNIIEKDRARARDLKGGHLGTRAAPISVTNSVVIYTAQVGVGNPATNYTLLVDTGSSITWIGASKAYTKTSTSKDTGNTVGRSVCVLWFWKLLWRGVDRYRHALLRSGNKDQSIGVASSATGFDGVDGILGIGPVDLTAGTVSGTNTVPTVSDNLLSQGTISEEVLGIYYVPVSASSSTGKLTFGGYDNSVISSSVKYVPLTTTSPASDYWGIDQSISYDGTTILSTTAGIVDTGTTLILIASDAFQKYQSATGGTLDSTTGLLTISSSQYSSLKTLSFKLGDTSYDLSSNAQIWPRSLNTIVGGSSDSIYLVVGDIGSPSGSGLDFIDGYTFLERYYSIFDTTNGRVGFASTAHTKATTN